MTSYRVETGVKGASRINYREFDNQDDAVEFAARWARSNSTGHYWAEVTIVEDESETAVIASHNLREEWPTHQPTVPEAPIPGRDWYGGCEDGYPRVNPVTGICESCGEKACPKCGHGFYPDGGCGC